MMDGNMSNWRSFPWFRSALALVFLAQAWHLATRTLADGEKGGAYGAGICLLCAGIVLGNLLLPWFTLPAMNFVDLLYFGINTGAPPPLTLRLAHAYLVAERWEDAALECGRQLEWHRESPELWACLIHAGAGEGEARELEALYKRARFRLRHSPETLQKFEDLAAAGPPLIPSGKSFLWQT